MFVHFNILPTFNLLKAILGMIQVLKYLVRIHPGSICRPLWEPINYAERSADVADGKRNAACSGNLVCQKKHPNGNGIGSISQSNKKTTSKWFVHSLFQTVRPSQPARKKWFLDVICIAGAGFFFRAKSLVFYGPGKTGGSSVLCVRWWRFQPLHPRLVPKDRSPWPLKSGTPYNLKAHQKSGFNRWLKQTHEQTSITWPPMGGYCHILNLSMNNHIAIYDIWD